MSSGLWKVEAVGPREVLDPAAERCGDIDPPLALSISLFDHEPGLRRLELLFDAMPVLDQVHDALELSDKRVELAAVPLEDEDWLRKSFDAFPAVEADRFRLYGSHDRAATGGVVNILVDAGEAFGTGHHGTTKGCLLAFSKLLKRARPRAVLDVGAGTGVLAIAAAKTLKRAVIATDLDDDAVRVARENAALNGEAARITVMRADGLRHPRLRGPARFDLIFANILAGPLIGLAPDLMRALAPGGRLILSGLLEPQERAVAAAYLSKGARREDRLILDGWSTLVLRKTRT